MIRGPIPPPHFTHDQDPDLGAWRAKQPTNNPFKDKTYHRHRHREGHNFGEPPRPKHQPVAGLLGRLGEVHGLGRAVRGRQQQQTPAEPIRRGSRQHDGWGHGCGGGGGDRVDPPVTCWEKLAAPRCVFPKRNLMHSEALQLCRFLQVLASPSFDKILSEFKSPQTSQV